MTLENITSNWSKTDEIWKPINGFEGLYEISNLGRLKSLPRRINMHRGGHHYTKEKILKTDSKAKKYPFAILCRGDFKKQFYIHRLVASAFIPIYDGQTEVNHINGDKKDNRSVNLEWCTHKENMQHAKATGLKKQMYGTDNPNAKLNEKEIIEIRESYSNGCLNMPQLAIKYKVSNSRISAIINRKVYVNFHEENEVSKYNFISKNQRLSKTKYFDFNSIQKMRDDGKSYRQIGDLLNVSDVCIFKFYRDKTPEIKLASLLAGKTKVIAKN